MRHIPNALARETNGLSDQSQFAHLLHYAFDELFENTNVQGARGHRLGVKLRSNCEPVIVLAFEGFNDSVLASSRTTESVSQASDGHMMTAGYANFAFAINSA